MTWYDVAKGEEKRRDSSNTLKRKLSKTQALHSKSLLISNFQHLSIRWLGLISVKIPFFIEKAWLGLILVKIPFFTEKAQVWVTLKITEKRKGIFQLPTILKKNIQSYCTCRHALKSIEKYEFKVLLIPKVVQRCPKVPKGAQIGPNRPK